MALQLWLHRSPACRPIQAHSLTDRDDTADRASCRVALPNRSHHAYDGVHVSMPSEQRSRRTLSSTDHCRGGPFSWLRLHGRGCSVTLTER